MTISTSVNRYAYAGNGVTTAFAYSSRFLANADIIVLLVVDATGVSTTQVLTTNYTMTGAGAAGGGTITMLVAPPTGTTLVIYGDPEIKQATDFVENDALPAETLETAYDRLTLICAMLQDKIARSFGLKESDSTTTNLTVPAAESGLVLGWAADLSLTNLALGSGVTVSSAMVPVVQAATVAAARAAMGALGSADNIATATTATTATTAGIASDRIQPINATVNANALTISASALTLDFRSATLGSGAVTTVSSTPANLVISSGSTLGSVSNSKFRIAVLAINNAGTIELATINASGAISLDETGLISTTAEGGIGGADSGNVAYSTTARSNLSYRVIGYIESTQAIAGAWATDPSTVQGSGGLGNIWIATHTYPRNVAGSRTLATTYYNTTGKMMMVFVSAYATGAHNLTGTVAGIAHVASGSTTTNASLTVAVPPGVAYSFLDGGTTPVLDSWVEYS